MKLTSFTDYTLRVLLYLGVRDGNERLATIGDIASAYAISENHLTKVVHHLARQGYIKTTRGKGGGMALALLPDRINIGEVVRGAEGNLALVECSRDGLPDCPILPACNLPPILSEATRAFFAVLEKYTLADLVRSDDTRDKLVRLLLPVRTR